MFVIEAENEKGWLWVSAVCRERRTAQAFLASVPAELEAFQRVLELPGRRYPFFIIDRGGFEYGDAELVAEHLAALSPSEDDDDVLLNVYLVREDFLPVPPGDDDMGCLPCWIVTNEALDPPRTAAITEELRAAERGAERG